MRSCLAAISRFLNLGSPTDAGTPVFDEKHYAPQAWQLLHNHGVEDNPGYGLVVHPPDADRAWVLPMDGTDVWPRTSPGGRPAVYSTRNGGESWQRQDAGMPREQAWWTVKRQAMSADVGDPVGLYFGTTSGELWASRDEGASWRPIARHLPEIYAVETARLPD